jgi:hypothetical protein
MYEMEGPRPARQHPRTDCSAAWHSPDLPPVPDTRCKRRFPDSSHVPEVAPGPVPVSGSESSSTPPVRTAQGVSDPHFKIL